MTSSLTLEKETDTNTKCQILKKDFEPPLRTPFLDYVTRRMKSKWKDNVRLFDNTIIEYSRELGDANGTIKIWSEMLTQIQTHKWKNTKNLKFVNWLVTQKNLLNKLVYGIKEHFGNLRRLELAISNWLQLGDKDLETLGFTISRHLQRLESLSLKFCDCISISNRGLKTLGFEISHHLMNLTSVFVFFNNSNKISDEGVQALGSQICRHLLKLDSLQLAFSWCGNVTDKSLSILSSKILIHRPNLKKFGFEVIWSADITDTGLEVLANSFSRCSTNLKYLKLNFASCPNVKDEGLLYLVSGIAKHYTSLKNLELTFLSGTDEGLKNIATGICDGFQHLNKLLLDFSGCPKITNNGLSGIGSVIANSSVCLNELTLGIPHFDNLVTSSKNISQEGLEAIVQEFSQGSLELKKLQLKFWRRPNVSMDWIDMIRTNQPFIEFIFE